MSISNEQRQEIIDLITADQLDRDEIAAKVGVSPGTVSAIKAHLTMRTYDEVLSESVIEALDTTFGLERDLQRALRANIEQLERGLAIIDEGRERSTEAGRIDITARDPGGSIVIIELKAGTAKPESIAQVLSYMGAVSEIENTPVRGILVAGDFSPRVVLAARAVQNLELKSYSFEFTRIHI